MAPSCKPVKKRLQEGVDPFCRRICKYALNSNYIVAQLVAPKWSGDQFENVVWPTQKLSWSTAKFTTEEFIEAVIADVKKRYPID